MCGQSHQSWIICSSKGHQHKIEGLVSGEVRTDILLLHLVGQTRFIAVVPVSDVDCLIGTPCGDLPHALLISDDPHVVHNTITICGTDIRPGFGQPFNQGGEPTYSMVNNGHNWAEVHAAGTQQLQAIHDALFHNAFVGTCIIGAMASQPYPGSQAPAMLCGAFVIEAMLNDVENRLRLTKENPLLQPLRKCACC